MNSRQLRTAIETEFARSPQQEVLIDLLNQIAVVAEAVLEMSGERKLATGHDPLSMRNRALLRKFIELPIEVQERNR